MDGRILLIQNRLKIHFVIRELLEKNYQVHTAIDAEQASTVIDKNYFDMLIIFLDDHIDESTWFLIDELHAEQSVFTPIIFVVNEESEALKETLMHNRRWSAIPFTMIPKHFMTVVASTMQIAQDIFVDKSFMLKRKGHRYLYKAKDILLIRRGKGRNLQLYLREDGKVEEFYSKHSLETFAQHYGIEKFLKQASQSWLVNIDEIVFIDTIEWEITLKNGTKIPTSRNYIDNFTE